jgi:hypothetical protein
LGRIPSGKAALKQLAFYGTAKAVPFQMSHRPYGARPFFCSCFPTLKRGANFRCASGAIRTANVLPFQNS